MLLNQRKSLNPHTNEYKIIDDSHKLLTKTPVDFMKETLKYKMQHPQPQQPTMHHQQNSQQNLMQPMGMQQMYSSLAMPIQQQPTIAMQMMQKQNLLLQMLQSSSPEMQLAFLLQQQQMPVPNPNLMFAPGNNGQGQQAFSGQPRMQFNPNSNSSFR